MKKWCCIFIFFLLPVYVLAQKDTITGRSLKRILYKNTASGDSLFLDLYLPEMPNKKGSFPVLMTFHGGAWIKGRRDLNRYYFTQKLKEESLENGFAIVAVDYSLVSDSVHFPDPIADVTDAVWWIHAHGTEYSLDTGRIGLWGASAGAQLALLAGYTFQEEWSGPEDAAERTLFKPDYVIDMFGPTQMQNVLRIKGGVVLNFLLKTFAGKLYDDRESLTGYITGHGLKKDRKVVKKVLKSWSPLNYAFKETAVPTLIFHGTRDLVVPIRQSKKLNRYLGRAEIVHELVKVKKGNHGFSNLSDKRLDGLIEKTITFMKDQSE